MVRTTILAAIFVCLAFAGSLAQDPTKIESSHYRVAFTNEHVEVISIHYGPHEKSSIHDHPAGVVVNITKAHLRFYDEKGHVQEVWGEPGEARWFPPLKHRVENIGDTPYNGVFVAFKGKSRGEASLDPGTQKAVAEVVASLSH